MRSQGRIIAAVAVALAGAGAFLVWAPRWGRSAGPTEDVAQASPALASLGAQVVAHLSTKPRVSPRAPVALPSATAKRSAVAQAIAAPSPSPTRKVPARPFAFAQGRIPSPQRGTRSAARLQLITRRLDPAVVGAPYHATLTARGGAPPYRWSLAEGLLPQGLRLDETRGIVYGVPAHLEVASCTLMAEDRSHQHATRRLTITVLEQMLPPPVEYDAGSSVTLLTPTLPDGIALLEAGEHAVYWNGRDHAERTAGPGIYFARLTTSRFTRTEKFLIAR
jgi:hypothetical protein